MAAGSAHSRKPGLRRVHAQARLPVLRHRTHRAGGGDQAAQGPPGGGAHRVGAGPAMSRWRALLMVPALLLATGCDAGAGSATSAPPTGPSCLAARPPRRSPSTPALPAHLGHLDRPVRSGRPRHPSRCIDLSRCARLGRARGSHRRSGARPGARLFHRLGPGEAYRPALAERGGLCGRPGASRASRSSPTSRHSPTRPKAGSVWSVWSRSTGTTPPSRSSTSGKCPSRCSTTPTNACSPPVGRNALPVDPVPDRRRAHRASVHSEALDEAGIESMATTYLA